MPTTTDALRELYESDSDAMRRRIVTKTGDHQLAQDLTQEAFLKVWAAILEGREIGHLRGYTWRTLQNALIDRQRLRSTHTAHAPLWTVDRVQWLACSLPADAIHASVYIQRLIKAAGIVDQQMVCLHASYFDDLAADEIAEAIGITPGAVKVRIARALARLREIAARIEGDPEIVNARAHKRRKITDKFAT